MASNLNLASNVAITAALSNLRLSYNPNNAWLDSGTNRYVIDTIETIKSDFTTGLNSPQIVDYMATSVLIHCFNGWTYLTNAINALLEGDYGNAIHNAYYAELRSIFSILSSQGIGVYNANNVLVDNMGNAHRVTPIGTATHKFAKIAFDEWLNEPSNSQTLLSLFSVDGLPLKDWISTTGFSDLIASELAADKFRQWSLDLTIINNESKFRNFVSYNPLSYGFSSSLADNITTRIEFISDLWRLCAPNSLFEYSILRNSYENLYSTIPFDLRDLTMQADWEPRLQGLGRNANDAQNQRLIQFLRRDINVADNLVFQYADNIRFSNPILESDIEPFGIISRACIMLLLNSKIIESILRTSGTTKNDLKFWSDNIGLKSGLWNATTEPANFSDLWTDVEIELDDINSWLAGPPPNIDPYHYKQDLRSSNLHIRNFAKAYLWNIGL